MSDGPSGAERDSASGHRAGENRAAGHGEPELADHFYVVLDGRFLVAGGRKPPGPTFTVDLYGTLEDFRAGKVLEPGVTLCLD